VLDAGEQDKAASASRLGLRGRVLPSFKKAVVLRVEVPYFIFRPLSRTQGKPHYHSLPFL
jgi:hypothetical protein